MRYGIMSVLAAAVMVAVAAQPAPAADLGSGSTGIHLAAAAGGYHGEDGNAVQLVQYRRGGVGVHVGPGRAYHRGPVYRHPGYWGPGYRHPGYWHGGHRYPYHRYHYRHPGSGFYHPTPGVGIGIGW